MSRQTDVLRHNPRDRRSPANNLRNSQNELQDQASSDQRTPNVESLADAIATALMQSITTAVHRTGSPRNLEPGAVPIASSSHQTSHSSRFPDGQYIEDHTSQSPRSTFQRAADMRHQSTMVGCKRLRYEPPQYV